MADLAGLIEREIASRKAAHEAPLNKIFQNHTGHRFLGSHSMAWATASREWAEAKTALLRALQSQEVDDKPAHRALGERE